MFNVDVSFSSFSITRAADPAFTLHCRKKQKFGSPPFSKAQDTSKAEDVE